MAGYGSDNVVLGAAHSCSVEASAAHALAARLPFAQILSRLDIWKTQRGHPASSGHSCLRCHPGMAAPTPRGTDGIFSCAD
jgi:hypothetical protein